MYVYHTIIRIKMANETEQIDMHVVKRNGESEVLSYNKILTRTKNVGKEHNLNVNYTGCNESLINF